MSQNRYPSELQRVESILQRNCHGIPKTLDIDSELNNVDYENLWMEWAAYKHKDKFFKLTKGALELKRNIRGNKFLIASVNCLIMLFNKTVNQFNTGDLSAK